MDNLVARVLAIIIVRSVIITYKMKWEGRTVTISSREGCRWPTHTRPTLIWPTKFNVLVSLSVGVGRTSVCSSVYPDHDSKINKNKVFKLGTENDLGYPRNDMVLGFQGHILGFGLGLGIGWKLELSYTRQRRSAWVGRTFEAFNDSICLSVCLFVRSITQKRMIRNDLWISYKWHGFGVERSKVKVTESISAFFTMIFGA